MFVLIAESAVRSLVLAVGVWTVLRVLRIRTSQTRSLTWTAVLFTSLSMPLLMQATKTLMERTPSAANWIPAVPPTLMLRPLPASAATPVQSGIDAITIVGSVYLAVAAIFLLRLFAGVWKSHRLVKTSVQLNEPWTMGSDVRVSAALPTPGTYGSTILLPTEWQEWSDFKRDAVLLHERCHVEHRHSYVHLLASVHRALFWFNPLAWMLQKELIDLAEATCDEAAIRQLQDRVSYAEVLLELAIKGAHFGFHTAMAHGNTLERRVERILQETFSIQETSMFRRIALIIVLVPLAALVTGTWLVEARTMPRVLPRALARPQRAAPVPQPTPTLPAPAQAPRPTSEARDLLARWSAEEVPDLALPEEKNAFEKLTTDEEREQFIDQFWLRRDPTPGTRDNEFRDEYYKRVVQTIQKFTTPSGVLGWKTDRGRIWILHGPPAEIETHSPGTTPPFERWRYRNMEGIGQNITLEFVDVASDGNHRLVFDPFKVPDTRRP
jgi:GWxTD domain-containing protein